MKIGARIKQIRISRRFTLRELAKRIGLTTSFLSQLERDLTSSSVKSLEKIAQALDVKLSDFFQEGQERELVVVKKHPGHRIISKKQKVLIENLASGAFDINMHSQLFTLGAKAILTKELQVFHGERFIMVLRGTIGFWRGREKFNLEKGDTVYCTSGKTPDKIVNIGKTTATILYISFLPA
jgi:transcriptional regulator with XRE-family HTH domain